MKNTDTRKVIHHVVMAKLGLDIGSSAESPGWGWVLVCIPDLSKHRTSVPFIFTWLRGPLLWQLVVESLTDCLAHLLRTGGGGLRCFGSDEHGWRSGSAVTASSQSTKFPSTSPHAAWGSSWSCLPDIIFSAYESSLLYKSKSIS